MVVDENEHMYTWGSSPQALRLANQIKRRANAKQKNEEQQRREMSKRFEATLSENIEVTTVEVDVTSTSNVTATVEPLPLSANSPQVPTVTITSPVLENALTVDAAPSIAKDEISLIPDVVKGETIITQNAPVTDINIQLIEDEIVTDIPLVKTSTSAQEKTDNESDTASNSTVPQVAATIIDVDPCEHMTPHLVDTSEVAGQILQVTFHMNYENYNSH